MDFTGSIKFLRRVGHFNVFCVVPPAPHHRDLCWPYPSAHSMVFCSNPGGFLNILSAASCLLLSLPLPPPPLPLSLLPTCFRVGRNEQVIGPGLKAPDLIPGVTGGRGLQDASHVVHSHATHALWLQILHLVQGQCQGSEILAPESVTLRQLRAVCFAAYRQGRAETSGPAWSWPSRGSWPGQDFAQSTSDEL